MLLELERAGPTILDRIAEAVQRAHTGIAAPREDEPARRAHADELVVDDVGGHPHQREVTLFLSDQLMSRSMRNEVRETLERDGVAVANEITNRVCERNEPGHAQNGNGCGLPTVIQRSSVNSSIAAVPPNLPQPLSLTPPKGTCGSSPTGWSLICTMPASIRCARARPLSASFVMIPDASPYDVAFARSTASSALSTTSIAATGPNVSLRANSDSSGTSDRSVAR